MRHFRRCENAVTRLRGYGCFHYSRESVVIPLFAHLKHQQQAARFDALYRYWKRLVKAADAHAACIEKQLRRLAKVVTIFHPATKQFLTN